MPLHLPTLSLLTVALLLSPLQLAGVTQTAQNSNSAQQTQPTPDNPKKAEADRLFQQGNQQLQTSQFQDALQSYQQALSLYREIDDRVWEGTTINNIGLVYADLGQYSQALEQLQQALAITREVGYRAGEGKTLNNTGSVYQSLGRYPQALEQYQQALAIAREVDDRAGEGTTLSNIGGVYWSLGQYPQALEQYQQALDIFREMGDRAGEGVALSGIGTVYQILGQYPQALEQFQQALVIAKEVGDRTGEGAALNGLGLVYTNLGQYPQALEQHQQALAIRREVNDRAGEGTTLNNIGSVYWDLGQYPQALEQYQQALAIAREMGDRDGEGAAINGLGLVYADLGQYPQALEQFQQALVIAREMGDRFREGTTINSISAVYADLGQYPQALKQYQQALAIIREVDDRAGEGRTLNNIGSVYWDLGQYPQALEQYQQALAIRKEVGDRAGEGATLNGLGLVYADLGQYPQALEQLQQALAIRREVGDRAGEGATINNVGAVYADLGQYPQALEQYQQALAIVIEVGDRAGEGTILNNIGSTQFLAGQVAAATKTLFEAVDVLDSLRSSELADADKVSLFDTQIQTYDLLQQALIAQNQPEAALEIAERGRARAFAELLSNRVSPQASGEVASIAAPTIDQIKQLAQQQNATLVEYSIARAPFQIDGKEEWRQSQLYIWVVKPTGEVAFRSVDLTASDPPFNALMNYLQQAISGERGSAPRLPPQAGQQSAQANLRLQQLYQVLIAPIADLLPKNPNDHVVFIPQGDLFRIPFPALQDANGQSLIQNHTILTSPSIQVLSLTQQSSQTRSIDPSQVLIVGNPTIPSLPSLLPQSLSSLPGAEQEAIDIARQFQTQPLLGDTATETAVMQKMASAQIIHLAAHGLLEYGDPEASGVRDVPGAIVLARSAQDDGLLTASEILNLKLNSSLVVLSACDSGLGRITGDGVIGLSRSLLSAGASSVVVSLWKVPDEPTAALMTEFYSQLQQQPDRAQALRQAMLKTMQQYPHPHNWAAFTLIGETE